MRIQGEETPDTLRARMSGIISIKGVDSMVSDALRGGLMWTGRSPHGSLHSSTPSPSGVKMAVEVHLVKLLLLLFVILLLALPLAAASVPLTCTARVGTLS